MNDYRSKKSNEGFKWTLFVLLFSGAVVFSFWFTGELKQDRERHDQQMIQKAVDQAVNETVKESAKQSSEAIKKDNEALQSQIQDLAVKLDSIQEQLAETHERLERLRSSWEGLGLDFQ